MDLKPYLKPFEPYLPYMVMVVGIVSAVLFVVYFAAETDKRKRNAGSVLAILLGLFSFYCVGLGLKKGIDLQGGASFLVRVQPADGRAVNADSLRSAQEIIEGRLNPTGALDVVVTPQGTDKLYVEVPGLSDEEILASKTKIERVAKLEFKLLAPKNISQGGMVPNPPGDPGIEPGFMALPYKDNKKDPKTGEEIPTPEAEKVTVFVKNKAEMSGKSVKEAFGALNPGETNWHISVTLHSDFGEQMSKLTRDNINNPMAINASPPTTRTGNTAVHALPPFGDFMRIVAVETPGDPLDCTRFAGAFACPWPCACPCILAPSSPPTRPL